MKKIYILFLAVTALLTACSEPDYMREHYPHSQPVIESVTLQSADGSQTSVLAGDSIEITAVVSDPATPLSTLEVQIILKDRLVSTEKIRTKGQNATVSGKYQIPFYPGLDDGTYAEIYLRLENVEGDIAEMVIANDKNLTIQRPVFGDKLYFIMEDRTVRTANRKIGSTIEYETAQLNIADTKVRFKIAEKITADNQIDYSGFVWGYRNGELTTIDEGGDFYEYNDPLITTIRRLKFDVHSFGFDVEADRVDPVTVDQRPMVRETVGGVEYMTLSLNMNQNSEIQFSGIDDLSKTLNPDFFNNISGKKATFLGLSGTYKLYYNPVTGFMHVHQPGATFPDALWVCGEGLGLPLEPYSATTRWGWDKPEDYLFCRKLSDGVFQLTFYTTSFNMKFYHINTWDQGEELSSNYSLSPANLLTGSTDGNWVAGAGVTAGVYRITIDVNAKTTVIEAVN